MRPLSASALLEVWERGVSQPSVARALTLLSACADEPAESLPALSIGQRDARLTAMYRQLFGETLNAFAECPQCDERLEYSMSIRDLDMTPSPKHNGEELALQCAGLSLRLRLPNSLDLSAVSQCETVAAARSLLAQRCILQADEHGSALPAEALPESVVEQIAARLSEADPQAERLINLTCAACSHQWQVILDIERFLWVKIASLAKRLLRDVHILARAYAWREADILSMSAVRRQFYLEMAGA
jgi:hypothetical protein